MCLCKSLQPSPSPGSTAWRHTAPPRSPGALPQARDAFYKCVEDAGVTYTVESPVPSQCQAARAAFTAACKASWVRHFDLLQDKRLRYLHTLRSNIARQTQTGTGSQQGKAAA